jgi:hypothetical protein
MSFIPKESYESVFNRGLPKWPQLKLSGQSVTVEQAKDIISRTDTFITSMSEYAGGNNHTWNKWALDTMGISPILALSKHMFSNDKIDPNPYVPGFGSFYYEVLDEIREQLGFIQTGYVHNTWMSSAFIFGPHGWCAPSGVLSFTDNVGKWPSVSEVYNDFVTLAKAFPFLNMTATLMSGEECEDFVTPVVTFIIKDGEVNLTDDHDNECYKHIVHVPDRSTEAMIAQIQKISHVGLRVSREQGVPNEWVEEFGKKFKPVMDAALQKLQNFIETAKCQ